MKKSRICEAHGRKAGIIGPTSKCVVFIDGASHPAFKFPFASIRAARYRFITWALNTKATSAAQ